MGRLFLPETARDLDGCLVPLLGLDRFDLRSVCFGERTDRAEVPALENSFCFHGRTDGFPTSLRGG